MANANTTVIPVPEDTLEEIWQQCCDLVEALGVATREMSKALDSQEVSGTVFAGVEQQRKKASLVLDTLTGLLEREALPDTRTAGPRGEGEETESANRHRAFTPSEVHSRLTNVCQIFDATKALSNEAIGSGVIDGAEDYLPALLAANQMAYRSFDLVQPILDWGIAPEGGAK